MKNRKKILEKKILNNDYISHRNIEYFEYEIHSTEFLIDLTHSKNKC